MRLLRCAVSVAALCALQGCAIIHEIARDPRDAPWDPRPGSGTMFAQIPSWEGEAHRRCGSRLPEAERQRRGLDNRC